MLVRIISFLFICLVLLVIIITLFRSLSLSHSLLLFQEPDPDAKLTTFSSLFMLLYLKTAGCLNHHCMMFLIYVKFNPLCYHLDLSLSLQQILEIILIVLKPLGFLSLLSLCSNLPATLIKTREAPRKTPIRHG